MFDNMRRHARLGALLLVLGVATLPVACDDDEGPEDDPAEEVDAVRLVVGTQTVTINSGGVVTGGPITLTVGGVQTVTATWIRSNGTTVTGLESEFELQMEPTNATIASYTKTTAFSGTLRGLAAGTTTLRVKLFHTAEQHEDFGQNVTVTVQ